MICDEVRQQPEGKDEPSTVPSESVPSELDLDPRVEVSYVLISNNVI